MPRHRYADTNGIEAADQISQPVPAAKILSISQDSDEEVIAAALSNGAKGYVFKLDVARELLLAVESVLRGQPFVSTGVLHSSTLHEHAQLSFGKAELRDATIQADQEFGKHPDDGFIQAFESGEMDGNFSVEFALVL